jgi:O-succinylbenzoic acid--CoA ligase
MTVLPDWLGRRALTHRDAIALGGVEPLTFGELDARATAAARRLAAVAQPGERVALLAANGTPFVVAVHAIGRLRAVLVPINARLAATEIARQLADAGVRVLLHDATYADLARDAIAGSDVRSHLTTKRGIDARETPVALRTTIDLDEPLAVIYTSGTTGRAKGAVLTWGNFWWSAVGSAFNLGVHRDDVWLNPLPMFHVGGLSVLTRSVIGGFTALVHEKFDATRVNDAIDAGATIASVVPAMLERMLDARDDRSYPATLRYLLLGGSSASRALLERCVASGVPVAMSYGLTESTSQLATLAPEDALARIGSSGRALLPTEMRIAEPSGSDGAGEIVVRGPTIVREYLNRPDATAAAWRDGWFHTGDVGRIDADGYLYVLDRRDDLIVSGGENVYPAEIESALAHHPDVIEAGVTGTDDARWGRVPLAFVRLRDDATTTSDALAAFLAERLARYKLPRAITIVDAPLPRNATGKLLRRKLAAPTNE